MFALCLRRQKRTPLRHFPGKFAPGQKAQEKKKKEESPGEKKKEESPGKKEKSPAGGFYFEKTSSTSTLILHNFWGEK